MRSSALVTWLRSLMSSLPNARYPIGVKLWIDTDDGDLFVQCLRNQKAVEGIFVMEWEFRLNIGVFYRDREDYETEVRNGLQYPLTIRHGQLQLFCSHLDCQLPDGTGAQQ